MNRNLIFFLVLTLFASTMSFAQTRTVEKRATVVDSVKGDTTVTSSVIVSESEDITPRSTMLVVNPLKFFLFYNLSLFQRVSPNAAVGFGVQTPTLEGLDGFGVNAELRIHPSRRSPRGFYVAPNVSYNYLKSSGSSVSTSPFSAGVLLGWQWFPGDEFAMGLGIGVDYYMGSVSDDDDDFGSYDGTAPALRFDIGYAW